MPSPNVTDRPTQSAIRSTCVSGSLTTTTEAEVSETDSLERRSMSCPSQGSARHRVGSRKAMHQIKRQDSCKVPAEDPLKSCQ